MQATRFAASGAWPERAPNGPIRVTTISAERSDRTSSSRKPGPRSDSALSSGERDGRSVGQGVEVVSGVLDWHRREPEHSADRRGHAFPGVGGRAQGAPLTTVDSGFEVDVVYVRAVKASRM
jgi:hypothetical protein